MLIMEQLISPNSHSHSLDSVPVPAQKGLDGPSNIEFDAELGDLDQAGRTIDHTAASFPPISLDPNSGKDRAFPLLLGLAIHGSADGLALGVANLENTLTSKSSAMSFVVFLALIIHKGMRPSRLLQMPWA